MSPSARHVNLILEPVMVSGAMRRVDRLLRAVAEKDIVVTLVGESGAGKEVIARRLHELSPRRAAPFVPINCAAIPETLFESELFGHEKGAFTGADQLVRGKIEAAHGGTLFLDELGELPLHMQAKLLRFLEHRRFMRVGGSQKIHVDVRLVCATLRDLEAEVQAGRFRTDLYYRVQGLTVEIPALRERRADIGPLAAQLVAQAAALHRVEPPRLTRGAVAMLAAYDWPGNVRQLRNAVELLCVLRAGKKVRPADLPPPIRAHAESRPRSPAPDTIEVRLDRPLDESIDAIIQAAVQREGGNRSRAALRLGIGLRTVQRRLRLA